jgi:hypothetical protein
VGFSDIAGVRERRARPTARRSLSGPVRWSGPWTGIQLAVVVLLLAGSPSVVAREADTPPPANTKPPDVIGAAGDGQVLTASAGEWTGAPPLALQYQWWRCDADVAACGEIGGARSDSFVLSAADVGATVRVAVTASNGGGPSPPAFSSATSVVTPARLVNLQPPAIAGAAEVGRSLTATPGQWQTSEPLDFHYEWLRCKGDGSDCALTPGRLTRAVRQTDVGYRLQARVTAVSSTSFATRESAMTAVVAPKRPPTLMRPFPVVRIKGYATFSGAVLQVVTVTAPEGARVALSCRGRGCPFRDRALRSSARVRLRSLERSLGAGTRLQIRVTKPALVGKYTSVVIHAGAAPERRDRCLMPQSTRPVRCPAPNRHRAVPVTLVHRGG